MSPPDDPSKSGTYDVGVSIEAVRAACMTYLSMKHESVGLGLEIGFYRDPRLASATMLQPQLLSCAIISSCLVVSHLCRSLYPPVLPVPVFRPPLIATHHFLLYLNEAVVGYPDGGVDGALCVTNQMLIHPQRSHFGTRPFAPPQ